MATHSYFLAGQIPGQRSLVGCSPCDVGHKIVMNYILSGIAHCGAWPSLFSQIARRW